jgi:hypothetical protein
LTPLVSTSCSTNYKNAKILAEDKAQIAITLNEDFSSTIILTNEGKRLEPTCLVEKDGKETYPNLPLCSDIEKAKSNTQVLFEEKIHILVKKGSICVEKVIRNLKFKVCDPPHDLSGWR